MKSVRRKSDEGNSVMRKTNGFVLAVVMLLLVTGCKPETPSVQPDRVPSEAKESREEARSDVDPSAGEAADRFLKALKSADTPEGKKTLAETRWRQVMKIPEYVDITVLSEEMFSTDIEGVKGFKRVVKLVVPREGERPYPKRHVLIAYEDTKSRTWKVFDFTGDWETEQEVERACEEKGLAEGETTTRQRRLIGCSYWLMTAGRIEQAGAMAKKANELYAQNPDPDDEAKYYKKRADETIDMIARMSGAQL